MAATGNDRNETKAAQRPDLSACPRSSIRTAQKRGPNRINELAEAFGVNRHTIERAIADGRLHLFLGKSEKVLAFEQGLAAFDLPRRLNQPHERHGHGRLSRSGLADQSQPLACAQIETDAIDRPHGSQRRVALNPEVAHLEDGGLIAQVRQLPSCGADRYS
jgi:hypothetical protein